jgi:hypothetical protein
MNSTPANAKARRTARSLAAVMDVSLSVSSARRMVVTPIAFHRLNRASFACRTATPSP